MHTYTCSVCVCVCIYIYICIGRLVLGARNCRRRPKKKKKQKTEDTEEAIHVYGTSMSISFNDSAMVIRSYSHELCFRCLPEVSRMMAPRTGCSLLKCICVLCQLNISCGRQAVGGMHAAGTPIKVSYEDSQPMFPGMPAEEEVPEDNYKD